MDQTKDLYDAIRCPVINNQVAWCLDAPPWLGPHPDEAGRICPDTPDAGHPH